MCWHFQTMFVGAQMELEARQATHRKACTTSSGLLEQLKQDAVVWSCFLFKEELPDGYSAWIRVARNLPTLIHDGKLREEAEKV